MMGVLNPNGISRAILPPMPIIQQSSAKPTISLCICKTAKALDILKHKFLTKVGRTRVVLFDLYGASGDTGFVYAMLRLKA
jgi:hypothetical protein